MLGRGTADSETLSLLGLGETEKDIVMLTVAFSQRDLIMNKISERMHLDELGHGIAFSIPFDKRVHSSVSERVSTSGIFTLVSNRIPDFWAREP